MGAELQVHVEFHECVPCMQCVMKHPRCTPGQDTVKKSSSTFSSNTSTERNQKQKRKALVLVKEACMNVLCATR